MMMESHANSAEAREISRIAAAPDFPFAPTCCTASARIEDHHALAAKVGQLDCPWVVTYDGVAAIRERLYPLHRRMFYGLSYSAQRRHKGDEVMFLSDRLELPNTWQSGQPIKLSGQRPHLVYGRIESMKPHTEMKEGRRAKHSGVT